MANTPTEGPDRIFGTNWADTIDALGGDDLVKAKGGNDTVLGGSGNDALYGDWGDDVLVGNTGNDRMYGGAGNDRMIWNNGDGSDLMEGGSGYDVTEVNGADTAGDVFTIAADGDRVAFARTNLGPFTLDIGTTERLEVNGQGGDDTITGGEGLDGLIKLKLDGGAGNDTITGGDGDDAIYGGWGDDTLTGGDGADTFVFRHGSDVVTDFEDGSDRINIAKVPGFDDFSDLAGHIQADGGDVVIDLGANELRLEDVSLAWIDASDFVFS